MSASDRANYADLHNHLLPGVDDGSDSMDETLHHLRAMAEAGVTRLAVSPHLHGWIVNEPDGLARRLDELRRVFDTVRAACRELDDVPDLVFGQEVLVSTADIARKIMEEPRVGYEGTNYVLIEFGFYIEGDPLEIIRAVRASGRRPIIAHPERYNRDSHPVEPDEIRRWKAEGALLQGNAGSILERHGGPISDLSWRLLRAGLLDLVCTDNHGHARPDTPARVAEALERRGAGPQARLLLSENPQRILDDRDTVPVGGWTPSAAA